MPTRSWAAWCSVSPANRSLSSKRPPCRTCWPSSTGCCAPTSKTPRRRRPCGPPTRWPSSPGSWWARLKRPATRATAWVSACGTCSSASAWPRKAPSSPCAAGSGPTPSCAPELLLFVLADEQLRVHADVHLGAVHAAFLGLLPILKDDNLERDHQASHRPEVGEEARLRHRPLPGRHPLERLVEHVAGPCLDEKRDRIAGRVRHLDDFHRVAVHFGGLQELNRAFPFGRLAQQPDGRARRALPQQLEQRRGRA